ncbi:MAG: hypothetical protein ACOZAM_32380 [Pseudomonadota bacterium]
MKLLMLVTMAVLSVPAVAEASHCKPLTQMLAEYKKISQQADSAEKRDDYATACKLRKRTVALADKMLRLKTDCFHGGKEKFEFLATSARALQELACSSGDDDLF